MDNRDIVTGHALIEVLTHLLHHKSFVSMRLVNGNYDRLTMITDLRLEKSGDVLVVDPPADLAGVLSSHNGHVFEFGFKGPDGLNYRFSTKGAVVDSAGFRLSLPSRLERLQRRRNFRVMVPVGTCLQFETASGWIDLEIVNISLGGMLGALTRRSGKTGAGPKLRTGDTVRNLSIHFPGDMGRHDLRIGIQKAVVRRVESEGNRRKRRYAFEFIGIERQGKNALTRMIYRLHREQLQRR